MNFSMNTQCCKPSLLGKKAASTRMIFCGKLMKREIQWSQAPDEEGSEGASPMTKTRIAVIFDSVNLSSWCLVRRYVKGISLVINDTLKSKYHDLLRKNSYFASDNQSGMRERSHLVTLKSCGSCVNFHHSMTEKINPDHALNFLKLTVTVYIFKLFCPLFQILLKLRFSKGTWILDCMMRRRRFIRWFDIGFKILLKESGQTFPNMTMNQQYVFFYIHLIIISLHSKAIILKKLYHHFAKYSYC